MDCTLEIESIVTTQITGRMGYLKCERHGIMWRGELMLNGRMGNVTKDGKLIEKVPVWFQRKLARTTVTIQAQYA